MQTASPSPPISRLRENLSVLCISLSRPIPSTCSLWCLPCCLAHGTREGDLFTFSLSRQGKEATATFPSTVTAVFSGKQFCRTISRFFTNVATAAQKQNWGAGCVCGFLYPLPEKPPSKQKVQILHEWSDAPESNGACLQPNAQWIRL